MKIKAIWQPGGVNMNMVFTLFLLTFISPRAYSVCGAMFHVPPSISQTGITASVDAQNGSLLSSGHVDFSVKLYGNTRGDDWDLEYNRGDFVLQPYTYLTATNFKYYGMTVYKTPKEGVGIAISINDSGGLHDVNAPKKTPVNYILYTHFKYYLVKIGDITSGVIPEFNAFELNYACLGIGNGKRLGSTPFLSTYISAQGCRLTTPAKYVNLGEINRRAFSGNGSIVGGTPFDITIDCNVNTKVDLEIKGQTISGNSQVLAINRSDQAAKGVGLLILHNGIPFALGSKINLLDTTLTGQNVIPFLAKFYQTEEQITPGEVNAVAQFTLSYR
ncbi:fimbrial protein [Serratia marcescens]|uniref:fimbrial protein n=1 Tax=Serratia marcescens TaxID=615 RepID=UPI001EFF3656|nr:fimbrial protein [Serratia marcescens]